MSDRRKHLEFLKRTAVEANWAGDYERALTLWDDGLGLARAWKDRDLEDLFVCHRATTLLEMDRQDFDLSQLKSILLRNPESYTGALAAYVSSFAHEKRGDYQKAVFYAQTALQKSRDLRSEELISGCLNSLANLELHESRFDTAGKLFNEALEILQKRGQADSYLGALYSDNLGYSYIAQDQIDIGVPLVCRSLELFEKLGARQALDYPSLDLCFAKIKTKGFDEAEEWGRRALALGTEFARKDVVKNSHYLLAETYCELGKESEADEHYEALADFYPNFPALKNYLRQISLMDVINLRA